MPPNSANWLNNYWQRTCYGGLISNKDGRINPLTLQKCLQIAIQDKAVQKINQSVSHIERIGNQINRGWNIYLLYSSNIVVDAIVICSAIGTKNILKSLDYKLKIEPVLGQVLDVEIISINQDWKNWPAVLSTYGVNLIPNGPNRLLIGATLENGYKPDHNSILEMKKINTNAPSWITNAKIINQWHGIRARPQNTPAPILEQIDRDLIIATCYYRNGLLLAPASAEWIAQKLIDSEI